MAWIERIFTSLPTAWAVIALIAMIGVSVVVLRGLIRFALRTFIIGAVGAAILGAIYYLINYTSLL